MKRLLCVYQHAPTPGAPGIYRHRQLFAELVRRGWHVDVVSTPRNYMSGRVPEQYRRRPLKHEMIEGIHHHWVWAPGGIHRSVRHRLANYAGFAAAAAARAATLARPDVVYVSSPPLSVAPLGPVLARRYRRRWLLEIRDIWPESAAAVGWLPAESRAYRAAGGLARRITTAADAVVVPTPGLVPLVRNHGARDITVVNGVVVERIFHRSERAAARAALEVAPDERVFLYLGAIGVANGLDMLLDAVEQLPADVRAHILIVGDGSARPALEREIARRRLARVRLLPPVAKNETIPLLAAADVGLHLLRPDPVFESALPTKVLEYLGAGLPFITTVSGLPAQVAKQSAGGTVTDATSLSDELRRWASLSPGDLADAGRRARRYGVTEFGLDRTANRLEELLLRLST